jgi:hypothetical protein
VYPLRAICQGSFGGSPDQGIKNPLAERKFNLSSRPSKILKKKSEHPEASCLPLKVWKFQKFLLFTTF